MTKCPATPECAAVPQSVAAPAPSAPVASAAPAENSVNAVETGAELPFVQPVFRDMLFHKRAKHDKWSTVEPAVMPANVADTHAHLHLMPDPALALARASALGIGFISAVTDIVEDGTKVFDCLDEWFCDSFDALEEIAVSGEYTLPHVRITAGVHPHNARLYTPAIEAVLLHVLRDPRACAIGEIGLDYYYDYSPRDVQMRVFRRQLELAKDLGLPVALHVRDAEDGTAPAKNAHAQALALLHEVGFPGNRAILHCCSLDADELRPWVEAGCYIAYGGALTFPRSTSAREAVRLVPQNRLLTETDAPYMAPQPLRGTLAEPAHTLLTAQCLCDCVLAERAADYGAKTRFIHRLYANALDILDAPPLPFQTGEERETEEK